MNRFVCSGATFEEVYTKYHPYFVRIAMRYVQSRAEAEDLVTDSMLSYWQNRLEVENVPAYLMTTVRNRCLNFLEGRRQHMQAHANIQNTEYRLLRQNIATLEATEPHGVFMAEVSELIRAALDGMPERTRRIFIAHKFENMSYKDIARLYSLSEGQVQAEMRSAKRALAISLKDYSPLVAFLLFL